MTSLSISRVTKNFGATRVLSEVSLDVATGEFFSLLGPSGCGKSTLLRIIAGLENADSGSIRIDGKSVDNVQPQKRGIGMVFQQYALWPHMTIAQNVRFGLETQPLSNHERDQRMLRSLDRVQMTEYKDRYPHQVSGGQQQRVALARALAMQPSVILLDEPLSNLDARLRAEIRLELAELHRNLGTTMIYVTHDQEDALSLSSRLAIMNQGTIEQVGTPQQVYRDPLSAFCARFIGDANLIPCKVISRRSETSAEVLLQGVTDEVFQARLSPSSDALSETGFLCIRPGALSVGPVATHQTPAVNALGAQVVRSSYKGSEYDIEIATTGGLRLRGTLRVDQDQDTLNTGAQVLVSWRVADGLVITD
ncbi:MAG: ABC transporter ATP-binding protein [Pseudomonadota bacterium]|jgi:ABC-type Fe3+/spermidine/putrescine transport system ATPase subunit